MTLSPGIPSPLTNGFVIPPLDFPLWEGKGKDGYDDVDIARMIASEAAGQRYWAAKAKAEAAPWVKGDGKGKGKGKDV